MAFSRDGRRVLSGSGDGTLRLWDVETGRELHCFKGARPRRSGGSPFLPMTATPFLAARTRRCVCGACPILPRRRTSPDAPRRRMLSLPNSAERRPCDSREPFRVQCLNPQAAGPPTGSLRHLRNLSSSPFPPQHDPSFFVPGRRIIVGPRCGRTRPTDQRSAGSSEGMCW